MSGITFTTIRYIIGAMDMFTSGEENVQCVKCFKAAAVLAQDFKQCKQMMNMYPPSFIQFHPGSGRLVDSFAARPRHHI